MNDFTISEADWKQWKTLRLRCIDKFCEQTFSQIQQLVENDESVHDRHRQLYRLVTERDDQIEDLFDPLTRSRAPFQIMVLYRHELITDQDMDVFSNDLQQRLQLASLR